VKPASFQYCDPDTLAGALSVLAATPEDARVLAGGQSLVPMMALRLARPKIVVDINAISELDFVRATPAGLSIGALTKQRTLERSPIVAGNYPLLAEAVPLIGHFQIRNRGTVGGSLAHADPAAELPAVMLALDGEFVLARSTGTRTMPAEEFFVMPYATALAPGEMLTEIQLPAAAGKTGAAICEFARRHGDFALAGVVARIDVGEAAIVTDARVVVFGLGPVPCRIRDAEREIIGHAVNEALIESVSRQVSASVEAHSDIHASADYRRHMAEVLAARALRVAAARATGRPV
jgi:CO/xanthine dehydrogenase FAD-binding subunit